MNIKEFLKNTIITNSKKNIKFSFHNKRLGKTKAEILDAVKQNLEAIVDEVDESYSDLTVKQLNKTMSKEVEEFLKEMAPKQVKIEYNFGNSEEQIVWTDYTPVLNVEEKKENERYILLTRDFRPTTVTFGAWATKLMPDDIKGIKANARWVRLLFNPRRAEPMYEEEFDDGVITVVNYYKPPKHRLYKIEEPKVPELLLRFIKNLFVTDDCFKYIMESVWYILNDRLQVFVVLNGRTGIGKGLFTEKIITNLVGRENAVIAPASWDKSMFNAWMLNKQFILMDEVKVITEGREENNNYLKRIIGDVQNIEKKGYDADRTTINFASFFITSNNGTKNFKLEKDNRRFAPVDLIEEKFVKTYTEEEQKEILKLIDDEDAIANLYWYIQKNFNPTGTSRTPLSLFECTAYYNFKYESLVSWEKIIVDMILSGKSTKYTRTEIKDKYNSDSMTNVGFRPKYFPTNNAIEIFLKEYHHFGDPEPLGTIEFDRENELMVVCNPKFASREAKDDEEFGISFL